MDHKTLKRNPAMDIVRCFALFCVVSVHFFYNNNYYQTPIIGGRIYIMTLMRSFFMVCVPLFIMLSGYLMCNKKINKEYFKKIFPIISVYILASICCVLYKIIFLKQNIKFIDIIEGFFSFENAPYSWYVEMYIGLFLLCPFLNVLYNNLKNKKEKKILIFVLLFLTSLPNITNVFVFEAQWFTNPTSSANYFKILPEFWNLIYPITYYFLGCYLKEFKLNLSCIKIFILILLTTLVSGSFSYYRSYKGVFIWGNWQTYGSIFVVVLSVLVFAFFDNMNFEKIPNWITETFKKISSLCFGAYLVSWIFDNIFYEILNSHIYYTQDKLKYYFIIVPIVYICSLGLSFIINFIYDLPIKYIKKLNTKKLVK